MPIRIGEYVINNRIGMHANNTRSQLLSGLQCKPFDREGVFGYRHLYNSQSHVIYLLCMTCMTYDCVHIHNHTDIDILICMNAYVCIYLNLYAFCIYFGSSAQALDKLTIVRIV